jgi:hypothetical protein
MLMVKLLGKLLYDWREPFVWGPIIIKLIAPIYFSSTYEKKSTCECSVQLCLSYNIMQLPILHRSDLFVFQIHKKFLK